MKNNPLIHIGICIMLIANAFIVLGATDSNPLQHDARNGPNLAPNPSFEEGNSTPAGWTYSQNTTGIYHWDSVFAHSGLKSVGVMNITNPQQHCYWTTDFIPVNLSQYTYVFSGWFKYNEVSASHHMAEFLVDEYDQNYHRVYGYGGYLRKENSEWQKSMDITINGPTSAKYVKLVLGNIAYEELNALCEIRFDDIYFGVSNTAPNEPTITGETQGKIRTLYSYSFQTNDPENDAVRYWIDWGDNTTTNTTYYQSGQVVNIQHIWGIEGTYIIRVKAIDIYNKESGWGSLKVTLPLSYEPLHFRFFDWLLERFPHAFPILRHILGH